MNRNVINQYMDFQRMVHFGKEYDNKFSFEQYGLRYLKHIYVEVHSVNLNKQNTKTERIWESSMYLAGINENIHSLRTVDRTCL